MNKGLKTSRLLLFASLLCGSPLLVGDASAKPKPRKPAAAPKKAAAPQAATAPQPAAAPQVDQDLWDIAELFEEKGDFPKALEIYDELRQDNPDNLELLDTTVALCRKIPACQTRLPTLLDELEAFIGQHGESAAARQLLLDYSQDLKDFKRARSAIVKMIKANPKLPSSWILLVEHHEETRAFKKLDALLKSLIKRFPTNPEIWLRAADRSLANNDLKGARRALKISRRLLKPGDQPLLTRHKALKRELDQVIEAIHHDYRQDTRWADLEDDFAHSTYP